MRIARFTTMFAALLALFPLQFAQASPRACAGPELRVMTYNIRLDTPVDGANQWSARRDLFVAQLRLLRPAILGLQEVLPGQRADLAAALPGYQVLGGGRDDGKGQGEASPLAIDSAVFKVTASGIFWLSPTPQKPSKGWDAAFPRVVTWARLVRRSDGRRVLALNTHWDHLGTTARLESGRQIARWIAAQRRPGETVVLVGDFNAPSDEASLAALLADDQAGMADARALAREPVVGGAITFNGFVPLPTSGEAIDHVLVSRKVVVQRYHVLAETFDGRLASDHVPVIADIALPCAGR
ncbi:endonuclease/exonuclease/phosphatase family protein [Novosphingobium sp.]|uniref:endonuclease/exonuclease/phosphatase family protein n=1 Tax=Novosphingobium sp. TaxID=1874826 RepID=UPI0035AEA1BC